MIEALAITNKSQEAPMYLSKKIAAIEPYIPGEQPKGGSMIKLNTNESPFPPSPAVREAILAQVDSLNLYPEISAETFLAALAQKEGLRADQLFAGNGSDEVLALCFPSFFGEERPLRIPALTYSFYPSFAQLFSIPYTLVPMKSQMDIDIGGLCEGGGVILANPNAPTSKALSLGDIATLAKALQQNGDVLIVDEAYIAYGGQSARPLIDQYDNLLVTRTLSKDYSLAGLRVGYAMGHPQLISGLNRAKDSFNSYPLDRLAIAGAAAAIKDGAYMQANVNTIIQTRDWFDGEMRARGFEGPSSSTNFVFLRHKEKPGQAIFEALKQKNILVRRFAKPGIEDYLRITIGTRAQMQALLCALEGIL